MNKSDRMRLQIFDWCEVFPGKQAALITPKGTFLVVYKLNEQLQGIAVDAITETK